MAMEDTVFHVDEYGMELRCTLCNGHIAGIETDEHEADSLQIVIDMYNNHECEEVAQ